MSGNSDRVIVENTIVGAELLVCLLCDFTVYAPAVPVVPAIAEVFGLSGETLARIHAEQEGKRSAGRMRDHLRAHSPEDWLGRIRALRDDLAALRRQNLALDAQLDHMTRVNQALDAGITTTSTQERT